jgi:hypothetical protein
MEAFGAIAMSITTREVTISLSLQSEFNTWWLYSFEFCFYGIDSGAASANSATESRLR